MPGTDRQQLPIFEIEQELYAALREVGRAVLTAPTGSGKSTQAPQMLIDNGVVGRDQEVIVLQPRRLATRMLARRVARERESNLGDEVGYAMRFERKLGRDTRILFMTEGLLLRQLLGEQELSRETGAIVFDEFHERHLDADLTLGLALRLQQRQREQGIDPVKLLVMSATLDAEHVADFLEPCPVIRSEGRTFPVEISYRAGPGGNVPVWDRAAAAARDLAQNQGFPGDMLIFMPGAYEIRRTISALRENGAARGRLVLPLYGELPPEQQDAAVDLQEKSKIVVSTNVAETSLTIPGITAVIDSGQAKIARHDARRGIDTLLVENISRAAADQRAGRAGRVEPGICLRLWSERDHAQRPAAETPEIARVDLAETVLSLKAAGIADLASFPWFESPPEEALRRAEVLLHDLGALDRAGSITAVGRKMAAFPAHPRYARLFLAAAELDCLRPALLITGFAQGRNILLPLSDGRREVAREDMLAGRGNERSDFFVMLRAWEVASEKRFDPEFCRSWGIHGQACCQAGAVAGQFERLARAQNLPLGEGRVTDFEPESLQKAILSAFSDHLARRRDQGSLRCDMVHGQGRNAELQRFSVVKQSELLVAAEVEERQVRREIVTLLGMNTAVEREWLAELFPEDFEETVETIYDERQKRVVGRTAVRFRDLTLETRNTGEPNRDAAATLLAEKVAAGELELKNWNNRVEQWIARVNLIAEHKPDYGIDPIDAEARQMLLEQVLHGAISAKDLKERQVLPTIRKWVAPELVPMIEQLAPEEIDLPGRNRPYKIRYDEDGGPTIAATVQEMYDVPGSRLRILEGSVPLRIELLAPSRRPIQVTSDLDAFWKTSYEGVKKELKGRYPKHEWR